MIKLKTDRGYFCFESYTDAHAFEDKLGIKAEWFSISLEDAKWYGGYYSDGCWQTAVEYYELEDPDPYPWSFQ